MESLSVSLSVDGLAHCLVEHAVAHLVDDVAVRWASVLVELWGSIQDVVLV